MEQVLSLVGAALVLLAFFALQRGRLTPSRASYQLLNLVGAVMLATSATMSQNWGFVVLNVVWAAIAVQALARAVRKPGQAP